MEHKNLERYLNSFGKQVVNRAKAGLGKEKGGGTALGSSIRYELTKEFNVEFFMNSYGEFLDKGVSGTQVKRSFKNQENQDEKSPFSYTTKGPPIDILSKWIKMKGIKPKGLGTGRSKNTGQFVSGFAYLISRKIKRDGIKALSFFQKPMRLAMKNFDFLYGQALRQDIEEALKIKK
tara:strand:- start:904 stop:1434 length:531 start_codon:yes stop_codon:yes gene_type:complete